MQKKFLLSLSMIIAGAMVMVSCNKMDNAANDESSIITDSPASTTILSFDSEADFLAAVQSVRSGIATKSIGVEDFKSLYDEFNQAMAEADDYYQREGGYEEFKAKFPDLYYPEYGEDYAAFLPVSDEAIAKLLNKDGLVKIAGKDIDYRDVWTYDRIRELGLAMPDNESYYTKSLSNMYQLTEEKQQINDKRKAWVTLRGYVADELRQKIGRVDLCFRKKGTLGWYNGKMESSSYMIINGLRYDYEVSANSASPHRYIAAWRGMHETTSHLGTRRIGFECGKDEPDYSFTGWIDVDLDALLDKNNGPGFWESLSFSFPIYKRSF